MKNLYSDFKTMQWYNMIAGTKNDCQIAIELRDEEEAREALEDERREWEHEKRYRLAIEESEKEYKEKRLLRKTNEEILRNPSFSKEEKKQAQEILDQMDEDELVADEQYFSAGLEYGYLIEKDSRLEALEKKELAKRIEEWEKINELKPKWKIWDWELMSRR